MQELFNKESFKEILKDLKEEKNGREAALLIRRFIASLELNGYFEDQEHLEKWQVEEYLLKFLSTFGMPNGNPNELQLIELEQKLFK